ncbi:hypothetical protein KIN20_023902 [Parelaphostrongylus tenuis]|uniref:Secreted protein n=1 Tax=Parelaphostrongylus tenuis TaxID=148309 RepID=A0AAD5N707_PARTN|nr:hypothetical protein KIN20_023902 [Parelaphostrongylus tenuis]
MSSVARVAALSALYLVRSSLTLICPLPSAGGLPQRNKTCPDFKADPSFIYCCTSKLPPTSGIYREKHGIFCCSLASFEKERQEIADEEFHNFIKRVRCHRSVCFVKRRDNLHDNSGGGEEATLFTGVPVFFGQWNDNRSCVRAHEHKG